MQKITIVTFVPFQHSNLSYIQTMLNYAREQPTGTPEGVFTSSLIYINAVDYVATHLLENLYRISHLIVQREMKSIVSPLKLGKISAPLGTLISSLKEFDFPDKREFISDLEEFKETRNTVAHNLLSLTPEEIEKIDSKLEVFRQTAERIISRYDGIVKGVTLAWTSYVAGQAPSLEGQQEPVATASVSDDQPETKGAIKQNPSENGKKKK